MSLINNRTVRRPISTAKKVGQSMAVVINDYINVIRHKKTYGKCEQIQCSREKQREKLKTALESTSTIRLTQRTTRRRLQAKLGMSLVFDQENHESAAEIANKRFQQATEILQ